jgi:hypothetical protein
MKLRYSFLLLFVVIQTAYAQEKTGVYRVKSGTDISKLMPFADRFQYDQFIDGQAFFRAGKISRAKFNYSLVHGELMFIAPNKDTLLMTDNDFIDRVTVGDDLYYYLRGHGHIQVEANFGKVTLGKKQFLIRMGNEKYAAYGQYSSTSAISSFSSYMNHNGQMQFLDGQDKVVLKRRVTFFLIDKNKRFYPATRANLLKIFSSHKGEVSNFLRENDIELEHEPDLVRTLQFCSTL